MDIIKPSAHIMFPIDGPEMLRRLEIIGRVCWKSEGRITEDSAPRFVHMLIFDKHHESVIEHCSVTVKFVVDRGVSHEIVRHRIASYSQESTRYCNYGTGEVTFIEPPFWEKGSMEYLLWTDVLMTAAATYKQMITFGAKPQEARSVLPNSLKTELIMTANLREWRHFFKLRTAPAAHPQMREVTIPLLAEFKESISVVFEDIQP